MLESRTVSHLSCLRHLTSLCARAYVCARLSTTDNRETTNYNLEVIRRFNTSYNACPTSTCLLPLGEPAVQLDQCRHVTYLRKPHGAFNGYPIQCGARFHYSCNTSTEMTDHHPHARITERIWRTKKKYYSGGNLLRFCFEHRPAYSDAARSGKPSMSICSEVCKEECMGHAFNERCTYAGCSTLFHSSCMERSKTVATGARLFCLKHLPADCEFVLEEECTGETYAACLQLEASVGATNRKQTHTHTNQQRDHALESTA